MAERLTKVNDAVNVCWTAFKADSGTETTAEKGDRMGFCTGIRALFGRGSVVALREKSGVLGLSPPLTGQRLGTKGSWVP